MAGIAEDNNYNDEIVLLASMFTNVSLEVITSVIESYNGDVNLAADAIMNFGNDVEESPTGNPREAIEDSIVIPVDVVPAAPKPAEKQVAIVANPPQGALSVPYSEASRSTGAVPKKSTKPSNQQYRSNVADPIAKFIDTHIAGTRMMIFMRGVPGSGKTYLAKHIIDYTVGASIKNYATHIFSTDSFFMRGGLYMYNKYDLSQAHTVNQKKVCEAANNGLSPIIVDNTNTELWELEPYARDGVRNGYVIEIAEPRTPWARNANQLSRKNIHGVPRESIVRMLERYDRKITPEYLMKSLRLSYPADKKPPVLRKFPPISPPESPLKLFDDTNLNRLLYDQETSCSTSGLEVAIIHHNSPDSPDEQLQTSKISETIAFHKIEAMPDSKPELADLEKEQNKLQQILEAQKKLEQFEIIEKEWDLGESWDAGEKPNATSSSELSLAKEPKPPREAEKNDTEKLIEPANICDDWTKISMFMPPWEDGKASVSFPSVETTDQVDYEDASTGFEVGDLLENTFKVLYGEPRDINVLSFGAIVSTKKKVIPKAIMLDKSTATHEHVLNADTNECKYKENHFSAFRKMFKTVPRHILRDIFDSCNGDVNWAVNIVLDSYPESQTHISNNEVESEEEEEPGEECQCLAAYNIIPEVETAAPLSPLPDLSQNLPVNSPFTQKKPKREIKMTEKNLELKRQIENNVIISDAHYSQHYLNTRRRRENFDIEQAGGSSMILQVEEVVGDGTSNLDVGQEDAAALPEVYTSNSHKYISDIPEPEPQNLQFMNSDDSDTESDSNKSDYSEKTIPVNLGGEFLSTLDELFGRKNFQYPENVKPVVNLPMGILRQINAHWSMSVASQMDDGSHRSEQMIEQDEDFARQLAAKEQEMSEQGKEPDVPSLKEIMDMELAYSIYEKNVAEWRNNEPQDLAAKLSREKLYNLFPDLTKDVLSEMLMAHDYSFKSTIESLLISTGQSDLLEDEKGVEKFVMKKEMERKEKFLQEQNQNLSVVEWPYLTDPEKPINLETVKYYREEAQKYLNFRNANFEKARQYFANNSPYAASFYSEIAALHTKKYEQSSCLAAAYLMNYHLMKNPDQDVLDLHYLHVPEAMVNLDIFLDQVILRLRNKNIKYKETWIITGKGVHSKGGPRIKPATKRRLKARDITSKQVNAGLFMAHLYPSNKMTNELES